MLHMAFSRFFAGSAESGIGIAKLSAALVFGGWEVVRSTRLGLARVVGWITHLLERAIVGREAIILLTSTVGLTGHRLIAPMLIRIVRLG